MASTQQNSAQDLFNHRVLAAHRSRAIARNREGADFLAQRIAEDLALRIAATNRQFELASDFFSLSPQMSSELQQLENVADIQRFEIVKECSTSRRQSENNGIQQNLLLETLEPGQAELAVSIAGLHWSNHLPATLRQIYRHLKPDGLFMAALPAAGTLHELRDCLTLAELELSGGAAQRVDPFIEIKQAGQLMQAAGFNLVVVDLEPVKVRYKTARNLIEDLRSMGATSALDDNRHRAHRQLFAKMDEFYQEKYGSSDGKIPASFNFAYLTGWSHHESQQKPLAQGSASHSLADILKSGKS